MSRLAYSKISRRRSAAILLVTLLALAAMAPMPAAPRSAGIVGQTRGGCTCHNQTESFTVEAVLDGLPDSWEPGEEYPLDVSFSGGPSRGSMARAGFNIKVSDGELVAPKDSLLVRVDPGSGDATHTKEGSNSSAWSVIWRSPSEGTGDVTFSLVVNAVNGDGIQGPGDQWGRTEVEVPEDDPGGLGPASTFWVAVVIFAVMAMAAMAWYATRGPRVERT
jgi:hypothetical protein